MYLDKSLQRSRQADKGDKKVDMRVWTAHRFTVMSVNNGNIFK